MLYTFVARATVFSSLVNAQLTDVAEEGRLRICELLAKLSHLQLDFYYLVFRVDYGRHET